MQEVKIIKVGHYAGLAKTVNLNIIHNLIDCNVTDRGINIAAIDVTKFNGYFVIDMSTRATIQSTKVMVGQPNRAEASPATVKGIIEYKTVPEITEAEFAKFLSTALWVKVD
tara:strand:- start:350 stop:685 length:336 start_codon:yes stop_codon:yes gene_type:complete